MECFNCFIQGNDIDEDKLMPTFLSVVGPKTFNLLRCLVQPENPGSKTYEEIVAVLTAYFSPTPHDHRLTFSYP